MKDIVSRALQNDISDDIVFMSCKEEAPSVDATLTFGQAKSSAANTRFSKIQLKKIKFLTKPAIAVFFNDVTHEINQRRLESQIVEQKNRNHELESYTSTISHEFRTPIATSLMFLETLVSNGLSQNAQTSIKLVI